MMDYRRYVEHIVDDMGCPKHVKGYDAIIETAVYMCEHRDISITAAYNEVGTILGSTGARVERCIRHAIRMMLTSLDYEPILNYFGNSAPLTGTITNKQFIMTIVVAAQRTAREEAKNADNGR